VSDHHTGNPCTPIVSLSTSLTHRRDADKVAWLISSLIGLGGFSAYVLLSPAHSIALILDIINIPFGYRVELLVIAFINIIACFSFERYAERPIAKTIAHVKRMIRRRRRKDGVRDGPSYKVIEGNMRSRRTSDER
jgi:cation-transporting ATPase 13A2